MNRVGGVTASCDHDGCSETHVVAKGDDPTWALEWAGWEVRGQGRDAETYCPQHKAGGIPLF